jgi:putative peptidoglycan lipid II flippase
MGLGALALWLAVTRTDGLGTGAAGSSSVHLSAISDYDPEGDGREHPEAVPNATDGNQGTYWTTESYNSFQKSGVGIVLDAGKEVELSQIIVTSDEPGFTAKIQAGNRADGGFKDVSRDEQVESSTTFDLYGGKYRYYVVWITDPNRRAHINEVRVG